jgi:hypothetical protein
MKSTNGLATNRRLIELEASLDIEERRRSGAPATREDLVNWCGQNNMPLAAGNSYSIRGRKHPMGTSRSATIRTHPRTGFSRAERR